VSGVVSRAMTQWRVCRDAYEVFREAQYGRAIDECDGVLLNRRGRRAGVSSFSLFMGPATRTRAYASEELLAFWSRDPRVTFEEFEASWPYEV